jgi:hypothetical protein
MASFMPWSAETAQFLIESPLGKLRGIDYALL